MTAMLTPLTHPELWANYKPWNTGHLPDNCKGLHQAGKFGMAPNEKRIAIVGARSSTSYGEQVAHGLAAEAARAGITVVSGLAYGIDAAAHRGALSAGGRTVAVLPCGLDKIYPAAHGPLAQGIVTTGALVTEYPLRTTPTRDRFLRRNEIIAGLVSALIVVEAAQRSGSMNAVNEAMMMGVPVYAVPGPITSGVSAGTNELLVSGQARGLTCIEDLLR